MGPDSDESFNRETLEGFQSFVDPTDPAGHFMRTVYVMRLHINCKACLMEEREREREGGREGGGKEGEREREGERQRNERRRDEDKMQMINS